MLVTLATTAGLVTLVVIIHYESLRRLHQHVHIVPLRPHMQVAAALFGALVAHMLEICLFALGFYLLEANDSVGRLEGARDGSFGDCVYYSFVTYTTLGFGDITPTGWLRMLTGMEALSGLVLIAWTSSFLFLQMQALWKQV